MVVQDGILDPYWLDVSQYEIVVYKRKNRKKKDGTTEIINPKIGAYSTIDDVIKCIVTDINATEKKGMKAALAGYLQAYKEKHKELTKILKINDVNI